MSFWSSLAHIAAIPAGFIPGVGPIASKVLNAAGSMGDAMGAAGAGRAAGRVQEAGVNQIQDRNAQERYRNQIDATKVNLQAPSIRAGQSVKGDVLARAKPFSWTGGSQTVNGIQVPQFSGGLSPDLFSDNTRALGSQMSAQALKDNGAMGGRAIGDAPALTGIPQAGKLDSILNTAGAIGGFADALSPYLPQGGGGSIAKGTPGAPNLPYQPLPHAALLPRKPEDVLADEQLGGF